MTEPNKFEDFPGISGEFSQPLLDALSAHIAILDANGIILAVNRAWRTFAQANGLEAALVSDGVNYLSICDAVRGEDARPATDFASGIRSVLRGTQEIFVYEYACHSLTDRRWFAGRVTRFSGDGPVRVLVAHEEITEQKRAQERILTERKRAEQTLLLQSAALEATANAIVITDRQGVIEWCNPAFEQLTGYTVAEALGKNSRELVYSGQQSQQFYADLWATVLSGHVWHNEIINRRKDGMLYTEEMTITPVRSDGRDISHFVAVKQDVTERFRREHEREVIARVASALRHAQTRSETIEVLLKQAMNLLAIDGAFFAAWDEASGDMIIEFAVGPAALPCKGFHLHPGSGLIQQVIETGHPCLSLEVQKDCQDPSGVFDHLPEEVQAAACVPLVDQDRIVGALCALRKTLIGNGEFHLLIAIAEMAGSSIHRATLYEQTQQRLERISVLRTIDLAISASLDLNVTLNILVDQVIRNLHVDAADILLLDPEAQQLRYAAGSGFHTWFIQEARVGLGQSFAGGSALQGQTYHVTRSEIEAGNPSFLTFWRLESFVEYYCTPLIIHGAVKGVLEIYHRRLQPARPEWVSFLETLAGQAVIALENARLFAESQRSHEELVAAYEKTIEGWSYAMDLRDHETEGHTRRVTAMSMTLARALGISETDLINLRRGALLHDIGKMGVPDNILLKAGPLTDEEWILMRKHPEYAYEMLLPVEYLQAALDIPYCHHERWDGSGYPRRLKGEQIPLAARLFAVVDVYDALTSDRPYRVAWPVERAFAHIRSLAGTQFDPTVVDAFLQIVN